MTCESPIEIELKKGLRYSKGEWKSKVPVACGKCPVCRINKVRDWCFRLIQEEKKSLSSYFITLTYESPPLTDNGFMTLKKRDVQLWLKRLRKRGEKVKYYICGEYGSSNERPHYHAIMFGLKDIENVVETWQNYYDSKNKVKGGMIHIGDVKGSSVAYTLKYLDKTMGIPKHRNDDRLKEFSLMSKNLGLNYMTEAMIDYHKADLSRVYVLNDGYKQKLPKYYYDRMYTDEEKEKISYIVDKYKKEQEEKLEKQVNRIYKGKVSIEKYKDDMRLHRWNIFNKNKKNRYV